MTEKQSSAGRGEGLAGLIARWRKMSQGDTYRDGIIEELTDQLETALEAAAPAGTAPASLIEASKNLLEACYQADALEELPQEIDGSLLDAVRDGLLAAAALATPSPQAPLEESCEDAHKSAGPVSFADCITNAESGSGVRIRSVNDTTGNPLLLLPDSEWSSLSSDSQRKIQKWFEIATEHLEQMLRPAATQEPAESGASDGPFTVPDSLPGHAMTHQGHWVRDAGSPRKVGEDGDSHLSGRIAARLDEYKFVAQMISGIEKEGWYQRRIEHLEDLYEAVPVGEQKQEEGV